MVEKCPLANFVPVGGKDYLRKRFSSISFVRSFVEPNQTMFRMMLGIHIDNPERIDVSDPVSDEFYHFFRETAKKNAAIYEEVFLTLPSDRVRKFEQLNSYSNQEKLKDRDPLLVKLINQYEHLLHSLLI